MSLSPERSYNLKQCIKIAPIGIAIIVALLIAAICQATSDEMDCDAKGGVMHKGECI